MLYLVQGTFLDPGLLISPQQLAAVLEKMVLPSLKQLAELNHSGKIFGGTRAGERGVSFIFDGETNKDVEAFLMGLPFWQHVQFHVTPLQSFDDRIANIGQIVERLKSE